MAAIKTFIKKTADGHRHTLLFAAFMFLQLTVLCLGNHAGEGYLSTAWRERVYYALQVFAIAGFLAYAAAERFVKGETARKNIGAAVAASFAAGAGIMLFADKGSPFYLICTFATVLCLCFTGGAVYHRMSVWTSAGGRAARSMGIGCAVATGLQFVLQLQWGQTVLLPVFMLMAAVLLYAVLRTDEPSAEADRTQAQTPPRRILFACLTAAGLILFSNFYNTYIHRLQIQTGYTDYNVYSWPRLILVPCYLLFAVLGDKRQGKAVPVMTLCIALSAMLNSVLIGSSGAYWLNMCLFYCAIAASVTYYDLTFWRLARGTAHPALWASMGRITDSVMVFVTALVNISALPAAAVLGLNIIGLAAVIVLMTVNGDFNVFTEPAAEAVISLLSPEAAIELMRENYALTPRETQVLRELVLTEDKQTAISDRLSITVKALQKYVTSLYRKTGVATRAGLTDLYHKTMASR